MWGGSLGGEGFCSVDAWAHVAPTYTLCVQTHPLHTPHTINRTQSIAHSSQVIRTCAVGGCLDRALELLDAAATARLRSSLSSDDDDDGSSGGGEDLFAIEDVTFSVVATECIRAGLQGKAEEVLDLRDYM